MTTVFVHEPLQEKVASNGVVDETVGVIVKSVHTLLFPHTSPSGIHLSVTGQYCHPVSQTHSWSFTTVAHTLNVISLQIGAGTEFV